MRNSIVIVLTAILLLIAGTYMFYLYGYKDTMLVYIPSFLAVILGWILLIAGLVSLRKPTDKAVIATTTPKKSGVQGFLGVILLFGFVFLLIAHYIWLFFLSSNRVEKILETQPTKITTATVIELREKHSKTGTKQYAVLNYHTDKGDRTEEIKDQYDEFSIGNKLSIRYALEYPDMFEIVQQP